MSGPYEDKHGVRHEHIHHRRTSRSEEVELGRTNPDCQLQVTLVLRRDPNSLAPDAEAHFDELSGLVEFVKVFALDVVEVSSERRAITVTGRAADMEHAFGVELRDVEADGKRFRRFRGDLKLPRPFEETVTGVFGLRGRPISQKLRVHHADATTPFWTAKHLADAYDFPPDSTGKGQTIALIELGGGYYESDLQTYFAALGIEPRSVTFVAVDGATNNPASAKAINTFIDVVEGRRSLDSIEPDLLAQAQATVEVTMDIQLAGGLAPGAELVVYMAPMTEQGMFNALSRAVSSEAPKVDVVSMSWGDPEPYVSEAYLRAINDVLADAAHRGITICASSGDSGSNNDSPDGGPCVNFPASSPYVLACGGTTVQLSDSKVETESAWNCGVHGIPAATGGGVSRRFELPEWQKGFAVPPSPNGFVGRGVPDVAGPADPHNGCQILVAGIRCSSAGTSAVAPLWAALIARYNELLQRRCGHVHADLYQSVGASGECGLRSIIDGDNGAYTAGPGWNPCTGLGTPRGKALLSHFLKRSDGKTIK